MSTNNQQSSFAHILYQIEDSACAVITLNRPECYNGLSRQSKFEVMEAIAKANQDENVKSIILTGKGKAFSSGQDLNDRTVKQEQGEEGSQHKNSKVDLGHTLQTEWNPLVDAISSSNKLVIGAINGVCAGAGMSVALACDLIVAKPQVKFLSGFTQIGLIPDAGSSFTLVQALGYVKALEFTLMGSPLYSEDLLQVGLINAIAENELQAAREWAQKIQKMAPLALLHLKRNLRYAQDHNVRDCRQRELESQQILGRSLDYQEGIRAFFAKRPPQFQGQ